MWDFSKRNPISKDVIQSQVFSLKQEAKKAGFRTRSEWVEMQIYFDNFDTIVKLLENKDCLQHLSVTLEFMDDTEIKASSEAKQGLPKADVRIVRKLPFKKYRYKIHLTSSSTTLSKINSEAVRAMVHHINSSESCRGLTDRVTNSLLALRWGNTRYFYSENEEILVLLNLIDSRIITKIEKYITTEEINAQQSTDIVANVA